MKTDSKEIFNINFYELFVLLKKRIKMIIIISLCALFSSVLVNFFILNPVYQAKTMLLVVKPAPDGNGSNTRDNKMDGLEGLVGSFYQAPEMNINTYLGQINSPAMLARVQKKLKPELNSFKMAELQEMIEVRRVPESNLIEVMVNDYDSARAARIANTLVQEFINFTSENNELRLNKLLGFMTQPLAVDNGIMTLQLQKAIEEIKVAKSLRLGDLSLAVVSEAAPPDKSISPKKAVNISVSFAAGLMVSLLLVFLLNHLDKVVESDEDIEKLLGLNVLQKGTVFSGDGIS